MKNEAVRRAMEYWLAYCDWDTRRYSALGAVLAHQLVLNK